MRCLATTRRPSETGVKLIFITLAITVALLAAGVWVGVALGLSGLVGLTQVLGLERALDIFGKIVWEQNTNFVLLAIPMFIFMGELLFHSGIMSNKVFAGDPPHPCANPSKPMMTSCLRTLSTAASTAPSWLSPSPVSE